MKKQTLLISIFIFGFYSHSSAQDKIAVCNGNVKLSTNFNRKATTFNMAGMNLGKYDWSDKNVNCHINQTIRELNKKKANSIIGVTLIGFGGSLIVGGSTLYGNAFENDGYRLIGGLITGAGMTFLWNTIGNKRKSNRHMKEVYRYYRMKNLF